jgi:hypothetical protein
MYTEDGSFFKSMVDTFQREYDYIAIHINAIPVTFYARH